MMTSPENDKARLRAAPGEASGPGSPILYAVA
jgi:hypothetical protein